MTESEVPYAGIATRAVALAVDAALAQLIVFVGGATAALVASLVGDLRLDTVERLLAAAAWTAVVGAYFVFFWSTAGQTPGMRLMGLRVMTIGGDPLTVARATVRVIGLALAIIPLFLGFVPVLLDGQRRALQDFLARTVVLYAERELPPAPQRVASASLHASASAHQKGST